MRIAARSIGILALVLLPLTMTAQDYRVRVDAQAQSVWFHGLVFDSVPASAAVPSGSGFVTADGRALRCSAGDYCYFTQAGPALHGVPVTTGASVMMWGFGVEGLSFRGTGRLLGDLGNDGVWPGTTPSAQLIEGLLEYRRSAFVARVGR